MKIKEYIKLNFSPLEIFYINSVLDNRSSTAIDDYYLRLRAKNEQKILSYFAFAENSNDAEKIYSIPNYFDWSSADVDWDKIIEIMAVEDLGILDYLVIFVVYIYRKLFASKYALKFVTKTGIPYYNFVLDYKTFNNVRNIISLLRM